MNKLEEKQSELVKSLKEQLHKSFMQIREMQNLFSLEIEHIEQQYSDRERQINKREDQLRQKQQCIQNSLNSKENFMVDVGELDVSLDEIVYKREETLKDSGIYLFKQILDEEKNRNDPETYSYILKKLEVSIKKVVENPHPALSQLFKISNQICLENLKLKQQIVNLQKNIDVWKAKVIEHQRTIEKLKRGEKNLQKHSEQLNELYIQQASQNARVEQQIREVKQQLSSRNIEIQNLKQKIIKLSDLLKTPSKLDLSKLDLKDSFDQDQYRRPPASLRMSSNAVLFRPKAINPSNLNGNQTDNNNSTLPLQQFSQKIFKKRVQKSFLKKSQVQRIK